eukprot:jgi/Hompol1/4502/HPOL_003671-RA
MAQESHGIFQFVDDMGDMDDDLFDQGPQRVRHVIDRSWVAAETTENWFSSAAWQVAERFKEKQGPNMVQFEIERLFLAADYSASLKLCREWLDHNQRQPKPLKPTEVSEIAVRCHLKLGCVDEAVKLIDQIEASCHYCHCQTPSWLVLGVQLAAQDYELTMVLLLQPDAVICMLLYLDQRLGDYKALVEISRAFSAMARSSESTELNAWAYCFMLRGLYYLERTPMPDSEFAKQHARTEIAQLHSERDAMTKYETCSKEALASAGFELQTIERLHLRLTESKLSGSGGGGDPDDQRVDEDA